MNGKLVLKFINVLILFSVLFLYLAKSTNAEQDSYLDSNFVSKRRQTSQASGLIPFPRIGRAANQRTWRSRILEQIKRREGLIPFPRVGRSGRDVPAWFSSRPVKDIQRVYPDLEDQWIASALKNYKLANDLNDDEFLSKSNQNQIIDEIPYTDDRKKENLDLLLS